VSQKFVFDERFVRAFTPGTHRVLGVVLLPFSYWHKLQLEMCDSPFATGDAVKYEDLERAVKICQTQYPHLYQDQVPSRWRTYGFMWRAALCNTHKQAKAFDDYLTAHTSAPKIMQKDQQSSGGGTKIIDIEPALMEVALYRKMTGCPREEPWNMSIGELSWINAAMARVDGADFSVITPVDDAAMEYLRKLKAQREAAK
jgi:hypothetical protein